jgi:hypothetical protein
MSILALSYLKTTKQISHDHSGVPEHWLWLSQIINKGGIGRSTICKWLYLLKVLYNVPLPMCKKTFLINVFQDALP